ncbi:MAG: serine/threonine protein kinase, partial [Anaerolineales bacterium]|nr:serine/threonine protein kinase [Anaerolineales bacterium]
MKVGRYEIVSSLGQGGMATVFRAYDPNIGRDVAIKLMNVVVEKDRKTARKRFLQEVKTIGDLHHTHIIQIYDAEFDGDQPYLVMPLMQGSVADWIQSGALSRERIATILDEVAGALEAVHGKGIVHRDLKPGNVLYDEAGHTYLAD